MGLRLDDSASALAVERAMENASPDQLRQLCQGLISGSKTMKRALDENGIVLNAALEETANPEPEQDLPDNFDEQLEAAVNEIDNPPADKPQKPEKPAEPAPEDLDLANSVSHRKEWMAFGRRLANSDAVAKFPEVHRLWDGSTAELWLIVGLGSVNRKPALCITHNALPKSLYILYPPFSCNLRTG